MSRIILANQSSTPDDAGSGNGQLFVESNKLYQQVGTDSAQELKTPTSGISGFGATGGTFTVPANVTKVTVRLWGAGGTGLASDNTTNSSGSGGGHCLACVAVTPGDTYTVTVGAGGSGGSSAGGNTSVTINSVEYKATGGAASAGTAGTGTNGQLNLTGQTGATTSSDARTRGTFIALGAAGVGHGMFGASHYGTNGGDGLAIFEW